MLTPAKLRELRHQDWTVDDSETVEATGWSAKIDLQSGLEQLKNTAR